MTGHLDITVPPGFVMVVRDFDAYNDPPLFGQNDIFLEDLSTGGAWYFAVNRPGAIGWQQWRGRQVFVTGGFRVNARAGTWDVRASGYLLTP